MLSLLIGLGIASCSVYSQSPTWWNKVLNSNYPQVAKLINQQQHPLIIADAYGYNPASVISLSYLSYLLKPDTGLLLLPTVGNRFVIQALPAEFKSIYLLNLPQKFRDQFVQKFRCQLVSIFSDPWNQLWQVQSPSPAAE